MKTLVVTSHGEVWLEQDGKHIRMVEPGTGTRIHADEDYLFDRFADLEHTLPILKVHNIHALKEGDLSKRIIKFLHLTDVDLFHILQHMWFLEKGPEYVEFYTDNTNAPWDTR